MRPRHIARCRSGRWDMPCRSARRQLRRCRGRTGLGTCGSRSCTQSRMSSRHRSLALPRSEPRKACRRSRKTSRRRPTDKGHHTHAARADIPRRTRQPRRCRLLGIVACPPGSCLHRTRHRRSRFRPAAPDTAYMTSRRFAGRCSRHSRPGTYGCPRDIPKLAWCPGRHRWLDDCRHLTRRQFQSSRHAVPHPKGQHRGRRRSCAARAGTRPSQSQCRCLPSQP
jgi:hypothetical protein